MRALIALSLAALLLTQPALAEETCECYGPPNLTFVVPASSTIACWDIVEYTGTAIGCSLPPTTGCNASGDCLGFETKCEGCDAEDDCNGNFSAIGYVGDWSGHEGEKWMVCHISTTGAASGWKCITLRPCD